MTDNDQESARHPQVIIDEAVAAAYRRGYGDGFGAGDVGERAPLPDDLIIPSMTLNPLGNAALRFVTHFQTWVNSLITLLIDEPTTTIEWSFLSDRPVLLVGPASVGKETTFARKWSITLRYRRVLRSEDL